jgi:hypothetical protein
LTYVTNLKSKGKNKMSLESKIEELTRVMSELNTTMKALQHPVEQPVVEQPVVEQPKPTAEDLKQLCLSLVRKNPALKSKIKAILDSVGASKAPDVKADDMPSVIKQIKALEV